MCVYVYNYASECASAEQILFLPMPLHTSLHTQRSNLDWCTILCGDMRRTSDFNMSAMLLEQYDQLYEQLADYHTQVSECTSVAVHCTLVVL
jgi:hypothetical protein